MTRIVVTRSLPSPVEARLDANYDATLNADDHAFSRQELRAAMRDADALCPTITYRIDSGLIATPGRRVRVIANYGAGVEHIDLVAARGAGIVVTNTPGALTDATAKVAILLMLMAARRAGEGEREVRGARWTGWRPTHLIGSGLAGKTVGLVGFGRIAQATPATARGLGMSIAYHSRTAATAEIEARFEARRASSLEALAAEADVLSLHVPGGTETRHLVGAALLAVMKPGAIVVNTARGPVVDEEASAAALASSRIAAAGLAAPIHWDVHRLGERRGLVRVSGYRRGSWMRGFHRESSRLSVLKETDGRSGTAARSVRAMQRKIEASGHALAQAMRMRLAVSMTRAATLSRRRRMVANSAVRRGLLAGAASRRAHISQ